jgi:hypothetical protein
VEQGRVMKSIKVFGLEMANRLLWRNEDRVVTGSNELRPNQRRPSASPAVAAIGMRSRVLFPMCQWRCEPVLVIVIFMFRLLRQANGCGE